MKKRILSVALACIIMSSLSSVAYAEEYDSFNYESKNAENFVVNTENICEEQMLMLGNSIGGMGRINRVSSCYCSGNGNWGTILGDNNVIGEGVYVTNLTSKRIEVEGYAENGTRRGWNIIDPGEKGWFGFYMWDGTYYFKARFSDKSSGTISIQMKSDWHFN